MAVDVEQELLKPPSTAPLVAEPIYASLPTLIGGPLHGQPVPVSLMNRSHIQLPVPSSYVTYDDPATAFETAMYERGKFAAAGSRRVLDVWSYVGLSEDERSALTWLAILERADLA